MSPNHFDPVEARDRYVRDNLTDAKEEQARWIAEGHTGISPRALAAFGNALQSVTDEILPGSSGFRSFIGIPVHGIGARVWQLLDSTRTDEREPGTRRSLCIIRHLDRN